MIHDYDPGVVCLQETKLGNHTYNPGLNYDIYNSIPPVGDHAHGGSAIIIHKSLQHSPVFLNTTLQAVAVNVVMEHEMTICSIYLPPDLTFSTNDIQNIIDQLPSPFLILGDFNAHNPLWGGSILDNKGKIIEDVIDSNPVTLFNDSSMTFHNIYNNQLSAIDLSLCSSNIHLDYSWSVNEYLNGSDHYPIHLKYNRNSPTESVPKWKVEEADWAGFMNDIKLDRDIKSFSSHIEAYDYLVDIILNSAQKNIPKSKGKPNRPTVPWWNKTCGIMRKVTRKCYRKYKSSGSLQTKIIYQRALAKQRKYYKKVKKESWMHYINGINSRTPSSAVWKKIRKLSGKFTPSPLPSLKVNGKLISDPSEVAEELGRHFSEISSAKNYSSKFQEIRDAQISIDLNGDNMESYNSKFTLKELRDALSSSEPTAPGEDTILYQMLKNLPEAAKLFLLTIINKIWETGILPKSWKVAIIIPTKKPNKDCFEASSYRPISLTSCVCKLMEKMINSRLVWYLENKNLISPYQFGFRKNRSTLDPLLRLSNQIQQGFSSQCQTIGVFFDLEKAYDRTWRYGIIKELHKMGIQGKMLRFIDSFLSDRYIKVRVGNDLSRPFLQEEGIPQGSVLSVTCFSVAINNIVKTVSSPVKCSLFVDDFAIYCTGYDAVSICRHLQKTVNAVSKWADNNGFKFSASKTVAVRFSKRRNVEEVPTITMKDIIIPYEKEVKFLGMKFDAKLTWASHIENLKLKVKKSLNILKVVSSHKWGADKKSLLNLYNSLCKSKLDYGCQIYSSASQSNLKKLDAVHNMGLRICCGAFRTSPIESLYVDTNEVPLNLRREELGLRYLVRMKSAPKSPSFDVLKESADSSKFSNKRASKPFQIRLNEDVDNVTIKRQKILPVEHPGIPPWFIPEISRCAKDISKKSQSEEIIRAKFYEHDITHKYHSKYFTDGSKSEDGVGYSVVHKSTSYVAKLPDSSSIFTAEISAIITALDMVYHSNQRTNVIYCDSKSVIDSMKKYNSFHPLVQKAQEWLFRISCRHKTVHLCWIPAHVGIKGNEVADRAARDASRSDVIDIKKVPASDMKEPIKKYICNKWQERWSSTSLPNNKKYKRIRNSINFWPSSFQRDRKAEIILTRLRIGHTRLTHKYLLESNSAPVCDHCNVPLSVEHILVHCYKYADLHKKFLLNKSLEEILGEEVDIPNLLGFLTESQLINEI